METNLMPVETTELSEAFTRVFQKLWGHDCRFIVNKGGTASSKSFSAAQKEIIMSCMDKITTLVIRKVASTLKDSVIPSFKSRMEDAGVRHLFEENKSDRTIRNSNTGSVFLFRGLDDPEKLKSIEGIDRILIEEATELTLEDFYELNRRARGREKIQLTLNFNPIDERHWLKKHFFEQEIDNSGLIESSYDDNQFITDEDIRQIDIIKNYDYNQYRIYALGEWGIAQVNNPWLYAFDRTRHISPTSLPLVQSMPVHLSFDFNINPLCCIATQHTRHYNKQSFIRVLKEFELRNTTVKEACKIIKGTFPNSVFTATGDATGRNRNAGYSTGNDTLWSQVQKGLGLSPSQVIVPATNPSHSNSRALCNLVLQEHASFLIDPLCKSLINDCLTARPVETDDQNKEDQLLKGAGDSEIGLNLFDCLRYSLWTHHKGMSRL